MCRTCWAPSDFTIDQLNEYFAGISFSASAKNISYFVDELDSNKTNVAFKFSEISLGDISLLINSSCSQARGADGIPQSIIKAALPIIGPHIVKIFNASLKLSYFPSLWKKSLVIALNKVKVPRCLGEHRPLYNQISNYIEVNNLIDVNQSSFRSDYSTQTALLKITDDIRRGIDRSKITLLLLFDFSKAFDRVCHVTLLKKLVTSGFSKEVIAWIGSYLSDRRQAVVDKNEMQSSFRPTNMGVPQGSVLGPLLFAIYINDVAQGLGDDISYVIFADDLQIYAQGGLVELDEVNIRLSSAADHIIAWANKNNLDINVNKTKAIPFGSPPFIRDLPLTAQSYIEIGHCRVMFESSQKSLFVVLDTTTSNTL